MKVAVNFCVQWAVDDDDTLEGDGHFVTWSKGYKSYMAAAACMDKHNKDATFQDHVSRSHMYAHTAGPLTEKNCDEGVVLQGCENFTDAKKVFGAYNIAYTQI